MFSQWRSKRHFPMDSGSSTSAFPSSSQPTSPVDSNFSQRDIRPMPSIAGSSRAAAGVKALGGRVGIGSKGPKFRPGTRDGSGGARSPMSFAAGPRSSSRGGNSFEFGGGVVPDDSHSHSHSEADRSDSSASPLTPQYTASMDSKPSTASLGRPDTNAASFARDINRAQQQHSERKETHARLESIDTAGSFEDFRSFIAFSSPSNLLDESPALTTSTNLSSPEFATAVATPAKDKPLPAVMSNKPQPPIPAPVQTEVAPSTSTTVAVNGTGSTRPPPQRVAVKLTSTSADEPMHLRPQSNTVQRRSTASSLPESVSQPGSSQLASEEFHSPSRETSNVTHAMRRLEESIQVVPVSKAKFGLGITSPEDASSAASTLSRPGNNNNNNTAALRNSLTTRRNTKTSSDMSSRSSADSWGRTSFGRDALRMLIDSENGGVQGEKPASLASNKTQKTYVSDSGHSINTAETSTDIHDSDQLSTIKERTESPESVLKRQISMESGLSQSDARTSRTSASSARSDSYRTGSPEPRSTSTLNVANSIGGRILGRRGSDKDLTLLSKPAAVHGIGSPTFGSRQRKTSSQSSAPPNELLPPLDLDAAEYSAHGRSSGSRLVAEPYTAPLPSLPFPASLSAPLLQASIARSAAQSSEPNTPNLAYEAALAKAVGKQRKSRPAALALNLSSLSAFPSNGSLMSPNNLTFRGLASPGKPRAPPPSAPPTEPLPPIPNTPSLVPKSPNPLQQSGSGHATASRSSVGGDDEIDPLRTPKGSRSPSSSGKVRDSKGSQMSQSRFSGPAPSSGSASDLLAVSATRRGSEGVDRVEPVWPAETRDIGGAVEPVLAVSAATSEASIVDSPTVTSLDERAESRSTTIAAAQTAKRAASRPVRYSVSRKEAGPKEEQLAPANIKAALSHTSTDGNASTTLTPSKAIDNSSTSTSNKGVTPTVKLDREAVTCPPASAGQVVSFIEPERRDAQPQQQQQQQTQAQSQPRRMTTTEKPSRPPPSAWNARAAATNIAAHGGDSEPAASTTTNSIADVNTNANATRSELGGHGGGGELRDGANSVASCHSTFSSISDRRREILSDKEALLGQINESTRQEILKRTEGRFAGAFNEVAAAFRQLQADKLLLEQIVREKTPLSGVGTNNEQLSNYLSSMNAKLDHSNAEIRKLLDLLEQQREVIEQLLATHQLEKETLQEDVECLHEALAEMEAEAERNRDTVIRLNAELTRAHAATVQANAEAMRTRTTLVEEERKREKVVVLLRQAKERLREVETEDLDACSNSSPPPRAGHAKGDEKDAELASLRKLLEERDAEIASLRLSHADAVMRGSATDDTCSIAFHSQSSEITHLTTTNPPSSTAASAEEEILRLQNQISEQKQREKQIRTAYMYVRDELRKVNTDRRRTSSSLSSTTPISTISSSHPASASSNRRMSVVNGELQEILQTRPEKGSQVGTPVKLKRLSLPIVARASGIYSSSGSDGLQQSQQGGGEGGGGNVGPSSYHGQEGVGRNRRHSRQVVLGRGQ